MSSCCIPDWHLLSKRGAAGAVIYSWCPNCSIVKSLFVCLQREDAVLPNWFCLRAGGKPVRFECYSAQEILSSWSWHYFSWSFFTVFLSCRKSVKEKIGRRKKKSNSKPYDFYFYNLSKESEGRCSMGQTNLCVWCKSSKKAWFNDL